MTAPPRARAWSLLPRRVGALLRAALLIPLLAAAALAFEPVEGLEVVLTDPGGGVLIGYGIVENGVLHLEISSLPGRYLMLVIGPDGEVLEEHDVRADGDRRLHLESEDGSTRDLAVVLGEFGVALEVVVHDPPQAPFENIPPIAGPPPGVPGSPDTPGPPDEPGPPGNPGPPDGPPTERGERPAAPPGQEGGPGEGPGEERGGEDAARSPGETPGRADPEGEPGERAPADPGANGPRGGEDPPGPPAERGRDRAPGPPGDGAPWGGPEERPGRDGRDGTPPGNRGTGALDGEETADRGPTPWRARTS